MNQLKQTADAILENAVTITIDDPAKNLYERLLVKLKLREEKRVFHVKPLVLGSLVRISKILLSIDKNQLTKENLEDQNKFLNLNFDLMEKHSRHIAEIVAIAVTNQEKEPPKGLINFFLYQLTSKELAKVFGVVISQMNVSDFISCIVSVKGLSVLNEVNPVTPGSQIASGILSEV